MLRNASSAAAITATLVLMHVSGSNSTRFGFSSTVLPRTLRPHARIPSSMRSARAVEYELAFTIATDAFPDGGTIGAGLRRFPSQAAYPPSVNAPAPASKSLRVIIMPAPA